MQNAEPDLRPIKRKLLFNYSSFWRKRQLEPSEVAGGGHVRTLSELAQDFAFITWTLGLEVASRAHLTRQCRKIAESRGLYQARSNPDLQKNVVNYWTPLAFSFSVKQGDPSLPSLYSWWENINLVAAIQQRAIYKVVLHPLSHLIPARPHEVGNIIICISNRKTSTGRLNCAGHKVSDGACCFRPHLTLPPPS